jgi:hypothetical protein
MLDLGLGSLHELALADLVYLLVVMVACIAIVALIGFDGFIVAIAVRYTIPMFAELGRRALRRVRSRV